MAGAAGINQHENGHAGHLLVRRQFPAAEPVQPQPVRGQDAEHVRAALRLGDPLRHHEPGHQFSAPRDQHPARHGDPAVFQRQSAGVPAIRQADDDLWRPVVRAERPARPDRAGFQNGGETSDLTFQYQYTKLDNYAYTLGSYNSQNANVFYSLDFGPTLNWRSDSRINYYARTGADALSNLNTLDINEFLTIDHNADLSSNYNYQLTRQSAEIGTATTQSLGAQYNEQVFRNLSLTEGLTAIYSTLPGGTISSAGVAANFNYGHVVPWEGQLNLAGGGGYLVTSTDVPAGVVPVVDAPYVVPPNIGAGATIPLRDRNIVTASIVVVVLKNGVRVTAVLDVDYTVQVDGDRTSLVPLATSALMQPGDPLNVSYVYQVAPSSKFQTTSGSASFGIDWPCFGFNYSHDQTDQTPLSGGDRHVSPLRAPRRGRGLCSRHLGRVPGAGGRRAHDLRQPASSRTPSGASTCSCPMRRTRT